MYKTADTLKSNDSILSNTKYLSLDNESYKKQETNMLYYPGQNAMFNRNMTGDVFVNNVRLPEDTKAYRLPRNTVGMIDHILNVVMPKKTSN